MLTLSLTTTFAGGYRREAIDLLHESPLLLVASLLLVVRPGAPSSVLAPSSDARSP